MRHLRSIIYALVLAPAVWILCGVGFDQDLTGRAQSLFGVLPLLLAGTAYAILLFSPISPAGPLLAGLLYAGLGAWARISPSAYADIWPASVTKDGFNVSTPGYGLAVLLAVPLIATALSARRWAGFEPPEIVLIGTIGRARGAATVAGTPMAAERTAVIPQQRQAPRPVAPDDGDEKTTVMQLGRPGGGAQGRQLADEPTRVAGSSARPDGDATEAMSLPDAPTADVISSDEPTRAVSTDEVGPDNSTPAEDFEEATREVGLDQSTPAGGFDETTREVGSDEATREVGLDQSTREVEFDQPARGASSDESTREVRAEESTRAVGSEESTREVSSEEPTREVGRDESTRDFGPDESTREVSFDESAREGAADEATQDVAADAATRDVTGDAVTHDVAGDAVTTDLAAEKAAPSAVAGEVTRDLDDDGPTRDITGDDTTRNLGTPDDAGATTRIVYPHPQTTQVPESSDDGEKTQLLRLPTASDGEHTQVIKSAGNGERTQVIRTGTVEPPGDRTQVLRFPTPGEAATVATPAGAETRDNDGPTSIVGQERPDPGEDPTTRLTAIGKPPGEATTRPNKDRRATVTSLERPADEADDDTRRLVLPTQREPADDDTTRRLT